MVTLDRNAGWTKGQAGLSREVRVLLISGWLLSQVRHGNWGRQGAVWAFVCGPGSPAVPPSHLLPGGSTLRTRSVRQLFRTWQPYRGRSQQHHAGFSWAEGLSGNTFLNVRTPVIPRGCHLELKQEPTLLGPFWKEWHGSWRGSFPFPSALCYGVCVSPKSTLKPNPQG